MYSLVAETSTHALVVQVVAEYIRVYEVKARHFLSFFRKKRRCPIMLKYLRINTQHGFGNADSFMA